MLRLRHITNREAATACNLWRSKADVGRNTSPLLLGEGRTTSEFWGERGKDNSRLAL